MQMLTGLLICPSCGSKLYVAGAHGDYLQCCGARDGICASRTMLPRRLAERLILESICQLLLENAAWVDAVHERAVQSWRDIRKQQPNTVEDLRRQVQQLEARIQRLVDQLENDDRPDPDIRERLRERRRERDEVSWQLDQFESQERQLPTPPTREWAVERLQSLHEVLKSTGAAANNALRQLLGGPLQLELVSEEGRKRKFWRGSFRIQTLDFAEMSVPLTPEGAEATGSNPEFVLDFRALPREEEQILECWRWLQQGYSFSEIAAVLGVGKARTTFIMKLVAERYGYGLSAKELKKRFAHLRVRAHSHDQFVEPAMALYDDGLLIDEIAARLQTNRKTIGKAIEAWHSARGLPVPDGRTRRQSLDFKGRSAWETRRRNGEGDSTQRI